MASVELRSSTTELAEGDIPTLTLIADLLPTFGATFVEQRGQVQTARFDSVLTGARSVQRLRWALQGLSYANTQIICQPTFVLSFESESSMEQRDETSYQQLAHAYPGQALVTRSIADSLNQLPCYVAAAIPGEGWFALSTPASSASPDQLEDDRSVDELTREAGLEVMADAGHSGPRIRFEEVRGPWRSSLLKVGLPLGVAAAAVLLFVGRHLYLPAQPSVSTAQEISSTRTPSVPTPVPHSDVLPPSPGPTPSSKPPTSGQKPDRHDRHDEPPPTRDSDKRTLGMPNERPTSAKPSENCRYEANELPGLIEEAHKMFERKDPKAQSLLRRILDCDPKQATAKRDLAALLPDNGSS